MQDESCLPVLSLGQCGVRANAACTSTHGPVTSLLLRKTESGARSADGGTEVELDPGIAHRDALHTHLSPPRRRVLGIPTDSLWDPDESRRVLRRLPCILLETYAVL